MTNQHHMKDNLLLSQLDQIARAKANHPHHIPVKFVRHSKASETLPNPKSSMYTDKLSSVLFKEELKIEQIMYALYEQIQIKGMVFYALKDEGNDKLKYVLLQPGPTLKQIYDKFGAKDHLLLIYHNQNIFKRKINNFQHKIIRFVCIFAVIWVVVYLIPYINDYFNPPLTQTIDLPSSYSET